MLNVGSPVFLTTNVQMAPLSLLTMASLMQLVLELPFQRTASVRVSLTFAARKWTLSLLWKWNVPSVNVEKETQMELENLSKD